jgi:hypothetical protein
MEPSNVVVAVGGELVERGDLRNLSPLQPVFPSPPILDFPFEDLDRVEGAHHENRGSANLDLRLIRTNHPAAHLEPKKEKVVMVRAEVAAMLVLVEVVPCPQPLRYLPVWSIWHPLPALSLVPLLPAHYRDREHVLVILSEVSCFFPGLDRSFFLLAS